MVDGGRWTDVGRKQGMFRNVGSVGMVARHCQAAQSKPTEGVCSSALAIVAPLALVAMRALRVVAPRSLASMVIEHTYSRFNMTASAWLSLASNLELVGLPMSSLMQRASSYRAKFLFFWRSLATPCRYVVPTCNFVACGGETKSIGNSS